MAAPFDFACREHLDFSRYFSRYFHTRADLDAHLRAEHTVAAKSCGDLMPSDPLTACKKAVGHAEWHGDGCGNTWNNRRGTYLCDLYHPEMEFGSFDAWCDHNKSMHLDCTFLTFDNGVGKAQWNAGPEGARPCVAPGSGAPRVKEPTEVCGYPYPDGAFCARQTGHLDDSAHSEAARPAQAIAPAAIVSRLVPEPKRDPPEFCAACHLRAPEEVGNLYRHGRMAAGLTPKLDGWMRAEFPYTSTEGVISEHKWLCPPCGEKVAKFIAHLSTPMLHEEDLL